MQRIRVAGIIPMKNGFAFMHRVGVLKRNDYKEYYTFPGGGLEEGETLEEGVIREIKEELNINISIDSYITTIEHDYPSFHLIMHVYRCIIINGDISLNEHTDSIWCNVNELRNIRFAPADFKVLNCI